MLKLIRINEIKAIIGKIKSINIKYAEERLASIFSSVSKIIAIITFALVFTSTIKGLLDEAYIMEPIHVPQSFNEDGMTSNLISWELSDEMSRVREFGWSTIGLHIIDTLNNDVEKDVVLFGLSINSIKSLIRNIFRVKNRSISGSLAIREDELYLKLSIGGNKSIAIKEKINDGENIYKVYDRLNKKAAWSLLEEVDPFVIASYHWAKKEEEKCLNMVRKIIREGHSVDSAYLLWGEILASKGEYLESIEKFKKSIEANKNQYLAWNAWGTVLIMQGKPRDSYDKFRRSTSIKATFWDSWYQWGVALSMDGRHRDAIDKFLKAMHVKPNDNSSYNEISYEYEAIGDLDTAIGYLLKGIEMSEDVGVLYATLSEMYWKKNETKKAFDSLEKSLENGFDISPYIEDEPYKSFTTEAL